MSLREVAESLDLLAADWKIDPVLRDFVLQKITSVSDYAVRAGDVTFHIPYLEDHKKYVLWKCYWPDCHNCCERQGRLPLTSDDLITIGRGLKYDRVSDFVKKETVTATWSEAAPGGASTMTMINLKRKPDETEKDDGTRIPCRFLDKEGSCGIHPGRPGVCYLYPFATWIASEQDRARIHAAFQFTGDCPGFYLADSADEMAPVLEQYSEIIQNYALQSMRTIREGFGAASI